MFRFAIISVFFLVSSLQAKVIEAPTTADALAEVDADTLLIFDLDNTIVMPAQTLGGEEWFDYLVEKSLDEGQDKDTAIDHALEVWNAVMKVTTVVAAEADGPRLIAEKQKLGTMTMALTARPGDLAAVTHKQLTSVGIHLYKNTISTKPLSVSGVEPAPFENGVAFVGAKNNKGDVLVKLLDALKLSPKRIVFVDNKQKHVDAVEKALAGRGIDYVGCRLGVTDAKIRAFNPKIADIQLKYFGGILDDTAAAVLEASGIK